MQYIVKEELNRLLIQPNRQTLQQRNIVVDDFLDFEVVIVDNDFVHHGMPQNVVYAVYEHDYAELCGCAHVLDQYAYRLQNLDVHLINVRGQEAVEVAKDVVLAKDAG